MIWVLTQHKKESSLGDSKLASDLSETSKGSTNCCVILGNVCMWEGGQEGYRENRVSPQETRRHMVIVWVYRKKKMVRTINSRQIIFPHCIFFQYQSVSQSKGKDNNLKIFGYIALVLEFYTRWNYQNKLC